MTLSDDYQHQPLTPTFGGTSVAGAGMSQDQDPVEDILAEIEDEERPQRKQSRKQSRKLDESEWGQIVALWESGGISANELSSRYGVTKQSIVNGLNRRGAIYGRQAAEDAKKIAKDSREDMTVLITRAKETKDFHYKSSAVLASLAQKKIVQAEHGDISYARADEELKTILTAMKIQGEARKERFAVLGLDNPDNFIAEELPELSIVEMSSEEIERIRAYQEHIAEEAKRELEELENG